MRSFTRVLSTIKQFKKITTVALVSLSLGSAMLASAADLQIQSIPAGSVNIPQPQAKKSVATNIYIVQLKGDPAVTYAGDIKGYLATRPGNDKKIDVNNAHVKKYVKHLETVQHEVLDSVGASMVYSYCYAFNGVAARMTAADAQALRSRDDVVHVWKDEILQLQTDTSPNYIGLTQRGQAWSRGLTGENVVIGSIDSGIWPEHPSFADVRTPIRGNWGWKIPFGAPPAGFSSSGCDFGNTAANALDAPFSCNNKLVTARCYNRGYSDAEDPNNPCGGDGARTIPGEFQSARDNDGHGSHTAATAGGNYGVPAAIDGDFIGTVSGVAPRARIAAYKVCWNGSSPPEGFTGGCPTSDAAAAIDQAIADGVDVINYSLGESSTNFFSPSKIAFLFAADAGVFVATSNGNDGPGAQTIGTPAGVPWITAVGNNQDDQVFNLAVTVNAPASIAGDKIAVEGGGPVQLSDTGAITADVTVADPVNGCGDSVGDGSGDPTGLNNTIDGIALVIRGGCTFTEKFVNAALAGASAIIVYNDGTTPDRVNPIGMSISDATIPGVMIGFFEGGDIASATGANATLDPDNKISANNRVANGSSRGPNGGAPDIIKPDVGAPGTQILAAHTPLPNDGKPEGELFQVISGTSMSSPHVAGSFALLKQAHPDWSPAQARSALMTTARQNLKKTFGDTPADPFDIGAGAIVPSKAIYPGLSYDAGLLDYLAFSCENNVQLASDAFCITLQGSGYSSDASELNLPSIGIAELIGSQTITRTVTSVARNNGTTQYSVSIDSPAGIDVSVSPSSFSLKRGETASYEVTLTSNNQVVQDEWAFGSLTWNSGRRYAVRSPIAVHPVAFATEPEVDSVANGAGNGSVEVPVDFGYSGVYSATMGGLAQSLERTSTLTTDAGQEIFCIDIPANTHFRFATFDADTSTPGADDLDLELYLTDSDCDGDIIAQLGASGGSTSEEVIDVSNGPAGGYVLVVNLFSAAVGDSVDFKVWAQPVFGDEGNTVVTAPRSAVLGESDSVTVDYTDLEPGLRYLGVLSHQDDAGEIGTTIIDVNTQ